MNCFILCFGLQCVLNAWDVRASGCEKDLFKNVKGRCCETCDPGQYVKEECSENGRTKCSPCKAGEYQDSINPYDSCNPCLTCANNTVKKCTATSNAQCSCSAGYVCSNNRCSKCEVKTCRPGERLQRVGKGIIEYSYNCEPCPDNTYSDTHNGSCKPLTQCSAFGFITVFPGNKTHNSICTLHGEPRGDSMKENVKTVVTILACSILLLLLLGACVKKTVKRNHANSIALIAPVVPANTPDYPYPKEESGDEFAIRHSSTMMSPMCQDESKDNIIDFLFMSRAKGHFEC